LSWKRDALGPSVAQPQMDVDGFIEARKSGAEKRL
jgi:hypothetical protein